MLKMMGWIGLSGATLVMTPVASAMMLQEAPAVPAVADPTLVPADLPSDTLAQSICTRIKALASDSDPTRFEAEMVYALSESGQDVKTQSDALLRLRTICPMGNGMELAVNNARASVNRGGTAGTAGIAASLGQGGFDTGSAFSSPSVNLGGGSVTYS